MITSITFSSTQLEKIDLLLLDTPDYARLRFSNRKIEFRSDLKEYKGLYKYNFISFPVDVVPRGYEFYVSQSFITDYHKYHAIRNNLREELLMRQLDNTGEERQRELISSMIREKVMNLSFEFEKALKWARTSYIFAGITDNVTILRNLLNLYRNVRKQEAFQISHFGGMTLPKEVSDLMTDIYIIYLTDRLAMMEIKDVRTDQMITPTQELGARLKWHGKQQHLVELYLMLEQKGWVTNNGLSKKKVAELLCQLFDISSTKRKEDSNSIESIYQLLKGLTDKDDRYKVNYFFDEPKYSRQFDNISTLIK